MFVILYITSSYLSVLILTLYVYVQLCVPWGGGGKEGGGGAGWGGVGDVCVLWGDGGKCSVYVWCVFVFCINIVLKSIKS